MTEKGHWCGAVKWSPNKRQRPFPYCIHAVKQWNKWVIVHWPIVDLEKWVVDRALGISERVTTDASVKCWANPVRTGCPTDRNTNCCSHFSIIPSAETAAAVWGHIYEFSISTRGIDTRTENKCRWQSVITSLMILWRRNIHSLLTLAAEPSEPNVGAAVQPRGWPVSQGFPKWKRTAKVCTYCTLRKERAAGVVPAFTLLQKKSQVHFARASNTTFRGHQDQSTSSKLRFSIRAWYTNSEHSQWLSVLVVSAVELHCLSGERAEFPYVYSVPVSQLKCKPCVSHVFVSVHNDKEQRGSNC